MTKQSSRNPINGVVRYALQRFHAYQTAQDFQKANEIERKYRPVLVWAAAGQGTEDISLTRLENSDNHPVEFLDVYDVNDDYHARVEVNARLVPALMVSTERSKPITTEQWAIQDYKAAMTKRQYGLAQVIYGLHECVRQYADTFSIDDEEIDKARRAKLTASHVYDSLDAFLAKEELVRFAQVGEVNLAAKS